MKNQESSKKIHKLKIDTRFPFVTIGISSHENDYRLIWAINTRLNMPFVKMDDFNFTGDGSPGNSFSRFSYDDTDRYVTFYIISNRCDNGYLIPEYRTVDFFLFMKGEVSTHMREELVKKLRQVEIISMAFFIDNKTIKSSRKLIHLDA
jgi:hypothetical protein